MSIPSPVFPTMKDGFGTKLFAMRFRWTLTGLFFGGLVTAALVIWFLAVENQDLPLSLIEIVAWLALLSTSWMYQGFPSGVSVLRANVLLIFAGAIQWGIIGFLVDLVLTMRDKLACSALLRFALGLLSAMAATAAFGFVVLAFVTFVTPQWTTTWATAGAGYKTVLVALTIVVYGAVVFLLWRRHRAFAVGVIVYAFVDIAVTMLGM